MAMTGAERQKKYKSTQKGREKNAELERIRKAKKAGTLDNARTYRVTAKYNSRDLQRLVEHEAGRDVNMRRRAQRVKLAKARLERTGTSKPVKVNPNRGGHGTRTTSTQGHSTPLSRGGAHKEGNVYRQTAGANFGKGGQGKLKLAEWKMRLITRGRTLSPSRPTETVKIRDLPSESARVWSATIRGASIPKTTSQFH